MTISAPAAAPGRGAGRGRRADQLTGGRHGLSATEVRASQRSRIVRAMTEAVGERGYPGVRVSDVVSRAGVSRKTFYELFSGKEDCFAATYGIWVDQLLETTFAAFETETEWVDRLRAGVAALLAALAREPDAARLCFSEAPAAGEPAQERREAATGELGRLFEAPGLPGGPLGETLRGGRVSELNETLRREISAGRTAQLPEIEPELMCAMVLPFLGMDAAQRELGRTVAPTA